MRHLGKRLGSYRLIRLPVTDPLADDYLTGHIYLNTHADFKLLDTQQDIRIIEEGLCSAQLQSLDAESQKALAHSVTLASQQLPVSATPLLGREQEIQLASDLLLRPDVRLLTLTGMGGVGKTRLALALGTDLHKVYGQATCFVSLSLLSDPALVVSTIAQALGLPESKNRLQLKHLKAYLRDQPLLLILDNFEQVLPAAPLLTELLAACPEVKLLVTSRARLHIEGEYVFVVSPLQVPDMQHLPRVEMLAEVDSVAFFVQRAQAISPTFQLTGDNATTIAEICVRLEGLPLALELAATRCRILSPQALLARLEHRFEVLTGGRQDAPVRQQTLRNTIRWSYDLLSSEEQMIFRRLAVFVGGCTLAAAEAVVVVPGSLSISVLDGVASLLDKSLLMQWEQGSRGPRLYTLQLMREYGLECLSTAGELERSRQAHAAYFLSLLNEARQYLQHAEREAWTELLQLEQENIRAALLYLLEHHKNEDALRLATIFREFCFSDPHASFDLCLPNFAHSQQDMQELTSIVNEYSTKAPISLPPSQSSHVVDELTTREVEVLHLLSMGLSNSQIAGQLILSPHTISRHIQSIYGKLRVNSRSAATRYVLEHGLC